MIALKNIRTLVPAGKPVVALFAAIGLSAVCAHAQENIPIANHSFEEPALGDGEWANGTHPEWEGNNSGTQNWTNAEFEGTDDTDGGEVPPPGDGEQSAFLNPGGSELYQTVGEVEAGTEYTLTVAVGNRADRTDPLELELEIIAGEDRGGRILASTTTEAPENGTFQDFSVTYTARSFDSGPLTIAIGNPAGQAIVDNVRLTAVVDPDAGAWKTAFAPIEAPFALDFGTGVDQDSEEDLLRVWADDFTLQADSLRYAPALDLVVSLSALASVENYLTRQDFTLDADMTLTNLLAAGDNGVGLAVLGGPHDPENAAFNSATDEDYYGLIWFPEQGAQQSTLQIREGFGGEVLAETPWEGLVPFGEAGSALFEDFEDIVAVEGAWDRGGEGGAEDQWEFGPPSVGPDGAFSGDNVAGTGLDNFYGGSGEAITAWLRTPTLDLTEAQGATLTFNEFVDVDPETSGATGEMFHNVRVAVLDPDNPDTENPIDVIDTYNDPSDGWRFREFELPEGAIGREIIVEFRLWTDEFFDNGDFAGWFIDDVELRISPEVDPADYNFQAEGVFDSGGVLDLTFTLTDPDGFSASVSAQDPTPFEGNLFGIGGSAHGDAGAVFDFQNLSMSVGDEPPALDPIINTPFDFAFGSDEGRDTDHDLLQNVNNDWSLTPQSLQLATSAEDYHSSLATTRVFDFEPMAGDSLFLESTMTLGGLDAGTGENRVGLVLFGEEDLEVFDPENDGTYYTFQWIPNGPSGASIAVREGMNGTIVEQVDFSGLDSPPQTTEGLTYILRFLGSYNGSGGLDFSAVLSDGDGGAATISGTIPNAPQGNRFGFGARHRGELNPVWNFHTFTWSDTIPLPMPLDFHFGTAAGRDTDLDFFKTGFGPEGWSLETGALRSVRADVETAADEDNASATVKVFDYTPGADFAVRSRVTASGEIEPTLEFLGDGGRIVTEANAGDLGISGNNERTIEAWAYTRTFDNNGTVWTLGNHGTMGEDFTLKVRGDDNEWVVNQWGGDGSDVWFTAPDSLERWIHIAVVHTGSETIVYVDGEEVTREDRNIDTSTEQPFRMGWWQNRAQSAGFDGFIREVRVWNTVRSQSEIQATMDTSLSGTEDGLTGYWPLNEGEGNTAFDLSGNGFDGTFTGPNVGDADEGFFPVENPSFEDPLLDDGDWDGGATGWSGTNFGRQNWTDAEFPGTDGDGELAAPGDGLQGIWINGNGEVFQNLGPIAPNAEYTLTVAVGNRLDFNSQLEIDLEIINGDNRSGEILATETTTQPANGTFEDFSVTFTTGAEVSGNLTIAVNNPVDEQVVIDNVRLAAPEHAIPQLTPEWLDISPRFGVTFIGDEAGFDSAYRFQWVPLAGENGGELRFDSPDGDSESISLADATGAPAFTDGGQYLLEVNGVFDPDGNLDLTGTLSDGSGGEVELTAQFAHPGELPNGTWFGVTGKNPSLDWDLFQMGTPEQVAQLPLDREEPEETSFAEWQDDNFGGETNPDIVGPEATPANDGVPNLIKYAFGFDAMTPVSAADLPQPEAENGVLRLTYLERRNASDITYTPERSLDLNGAWDENVTEVSRVPEGDFNRVTVEADIPDGTTEAFLRVNVTQN